MAEERGQRVLERTPAREHHAVSAPANPAAQAAELALTRTLAREQGAYPAPSGRQTANTQPTKPSRPTALFAVVGMGLLGDAGFMIGWTATTRQRRPRAAAGT